MDHAVVYASALFMFFLATGVLFCYNMRNWKSHVFNPQSISYVLLMITFLADAAWIFVDGKPGRKFFNHCLNIIELSTFNFIAYCWLLYCCKSFPFAWCKNKRVLQWLSLPAVVVSVITLLSCAGGWVYTIDEGGFYHRGPLFTIQYTGFFYLFFASLLALICNFRATMASDRRYYRALAFFAVFPTVLVSTQLLMPPGVLPTLQFSIFISLMIVYIEEQNQKITCDSLTSLCNRDRFEQVFNERMAHLRKTGFPLVYLLMGDLNHFKDINDGYGHLEGDRVLQTVGNILDDIGREFDATVARMSGDEFCVLIEAENDNKAQAYRDRVYKSLAEVSAEKPYEVSISFGIIRCKGSNTVAELIGAVDAMMYEEKRGRSRRA